MIIHAEMNADTSPLKRSFVDAVGHDVFSEIDFLPRHEVEPSFVTSPDRWTRSIPSPTKRRSISISRPLSMTVETTSAGPPTFPSFMSVFGGVELSSISDDARRNSLPAHVQHSRRMSMNNTITTEVHPNYPLPAALKRQNSITSLTSESTESSPTTTNSTFDSPLMTDPSPSSSPESPSATIPLSPFKDMMRSPVEFPKADESPKQPFPTTNMTEQSPSDSPNLGGRNIKNLSLNMPVVSPTRPVISSGFESFFPLSSPASPFPGQTKMSRKKPTNLSIRTPGFDQLTFSRTNTDGPLTAGHRPILQHYMSSPLLPSLITPASGPVGGMRLPLSIPLSVNSRPVSQSSVANQLISSSLPELREDGQLQPPKSQETQERGYPNGPVKVYDSGVYLYLEPTMEEASQFDTVINVAKEIKNPFDALHDQDDGTVMSVWRKESDRSKIPEPLTAISETSFKSAFEWPQSNEISTPNTPKPPIREPEYVHVPWDHNSEIIDDLFSLCEMIDDRIVSGKTVLIHCQLGVSRSASLVIAYGLYKGYKTDFHSMYSTLKQRSQWMGPNMSLIYQLGDFRSHVERGEHVGKKEIPTEWIKSAKGRAESIRTPTSAAPPPVPEKEPMSNRYSTQTNTHSGPNSVTPLRLNKKLPPVPSFEDSPLTQSSIPRLQAAPIPEVVLAEQMISAPAPTALGNTSNAPFGSLSSTPMDIPSTSLTGALPEKATGVNLSPPLHELLSQKMYIPPHRPRSPRPSHLTIDRSPQSQMDLAMPDAGLTSPSLFSPRATEFLASPFAPTIAGDLFAGDRTKVAPGSSSTIRSGVGHSVEGWSADREAAPAIDPRSPHQKDDIRPGEILRHIDDFL